MSTLTNNIDSLSIDELSKIQSIISDILLARKENFTSGTSISTFKEEYLLVINSTFSIKYSLSVNTSIQHLEKFFGGSRDLKSLKVSELEKFKIYLMKIAPLGYEVYLRTLKAAFNRAIDWEILTENPFCKIEIKKRQKVKSEFLNRTELQISLNATSNLTLRKIFLFAFLTGARLGECVQLKWRNIDFEKKIITIGDEETTTKSKKCRFIPIANELFEMLNRIFSNDPKSDEYVFRKSNGLPFSRNYVSKQFKKAIRKAGQSDKIHFHSLRHSFGSILGMKGVPITVIKDLMGHSSVSVTEQYSHTNVESLRKAITRFDELEMEV